MGCAPVDLVVAAEIAAYAPRAAVCAPRYHCRAATNGSTSNGRERRATIAFLLQILKTIPPPFPICEFLT